MPKALLANRFVRFGAAGVAGLLVDLAVLHLLAPLLGWYAARVASFVAAATSTWWINRSITFRSPLLPSGGLALGREYVAYLSSMLGGAAINYAVYALTLHWVPGAAAPALGVALGSLAGLFANFTAARKFVFPRNPKDRMQALTSWPEAARKPLHGVFTDIDDTLTTDGAITPDSLQALERLKAAGLSVVAITGRPVGWSEPFAAAWPVDAIVAENGAVSLERATDSAGRECDIAIDHSEFAQLSESQIEEVVARMRAEGMHATVSSIHVNGWYGDHNKLEGARWIVRELWSRDLDGEMDRWAYVGDSTNDQLMFQAFANSVGVANIERFVPQLTQLPRYVTQSERGAGFAEVAQAVLAARSYA